MFSSLRLLVLFSFLSTMGYALQATPLALDLPIDFKLRANPYSKVELQTLMDEVLEPFHSLANSYHVTLVPKLLYDSPFIGARAVQYRKEWQVYLFGALALPRWINSQCLP